MAYRRHPQGGEHAYLLLTTFFSALDSGLRKRCLAPFLERSVGFASLTVVGFVSG